ncbi:putative branched-chain amino acid transaminase [Oceanococcus atlanticus]|uniref:Branched-chain-amino-acid aminotransferase n=1 Tax=Oceanococcus atlanticus TaxID=1317117 RepID=A0A1Y1SGW5_9GAMM|nr:branched-chain amino acid aminotransferase [Oceanococcus atlanticus]ORE88913.1 putative branched-chain amino acid transaminase [Oceanococcus atlanticus]
MNLSPTLSTAISNFQLPDPLGFGRVTGPVMFVADYINGAWQAGELMTYEPIALNPAATSLQFAQQCFEGLKAFWVEQDEPALFRPDENAKRMARSAERLCMPEVPHTLFLDGVKAVTQAMKPLIPRRSGESLYLRPMLYGMDTQYPLAGSDNFRFAIVCSPSAAYFAKPISVLVERDACRAAVGGTGDVKAGGNYAGSIQATRRCIERGYDQPLWLDPVERRLIEELSAMNICAIIDGALCSPALNGTILPGITRATLLTLADDLGMPALEQPIDINSLLDDIDSGRCSELFACGTAAIVNPIAVLADGQRITRLQQVDAEAARFKAALLGIQEGRSADSRGWMFNSAE